MKGNVKFCDIGSAHVVFTSRHGGCSAQPYDSLNIANHVGDDAGNVLRNRELLHKTIEQQEPIAPHSSWLFLDQTHENNIVFVDGSTAIDNFYPPTADASITQIPGQPLVVMTADCGPLVIAGQSIVGVVHASWRTVAEGIIDSVIEEMNYRAPGEHFHALLGPCIYPLNYEFESSQLNELADHLGEHVISQTNQGQPAFNLPAAIEHECTIRNVTFNELGIDTFSSPDHFSYRRDGVTGRLAVVAWLSAE